MQIQYVLIIFTTIVYLLYRYLTRNFNYWKKKNVVGPEPVALFGNLKDSTLRKKTIGEVFKQIYEQYPDQKVVGVYRMTTPCLLIRDLEIIKHVMIKDFDMFTDRGVEFGKEGLGANLFQADGETWRVLRNNFTPIFTSMKLKNMFHLLNKTGDNFIKHVETLKEPEQEMHKLTQKFTMASISACAFGLDIERMTYKLQELRKIDELVFSSTLMNELDMMYPGLLKKINISVFPRFVTKFFKELVELVIRERNNMPSGRKDFMDLLIEIRNKGELKGTKRTKDEESVLHLDISDDMIAAQAFVFYVAGYETTSTTMTFLFYHLARNPEIQDKLIIEIDDALEKNNGQITYELINSLEYLDKNLQETLRLHPIVEPLQRNAQVDYKLPGTDLVIKKGQTVLVTPMGIHHDEKYYPNPEVYDPERFSQENSTDRHPCAYMPFGVGPRHCIGMRFAKVQSKVCIVKFLSKYRVDLCKKTPNTLIYDPWRAIIGPKGGIYLNIIRRN